MDRIDLLIAIILTLLVILLSFFASKSIENILEEKKSEIIKEEEKNVTQKNKTAITKEIEDKTSKNESESENYNFTNYISKIGTISTYINTSNKEDKLSTKNYSKFEEAHVYDLCYAEEVLSIEGKNMICLNEIPKQIRINFFDNKIRILYNDLLIREVLPNKTLLLGFAFAKNFNGVEGEIIEFFTNSTFAYVDRFELGEISYLNERIIYASFPVYVQLEKTNNEDLHIFVKTSVRNYLISSIKFLVA